MIETALCLSRTHVNSNSITTANRWQRKFACKKDDCDSNLTITSIVNFLFVIHSKSVPSVPFKNGFVGKCMCKN